MSAFINILALAVPVFTLQVYDRVIGSGSISTLQGLIVGMGLVLVFDYVLRMSRSRIMQTIALRVDVMVGRRLFEKVMSLPLQELENHESAHWNSLFRDVDAVRNTLSGASAVLVADLPFAIFFLGLIFVIATPIAWVLLIIVPIFMLVAWRSGKVISSANKEEQSTGASRDSLIGEMIAGRTTIKALALDGAMRPMWEQKHAENIEQSIIRGGISDRYSNLGASLTMLTSICLTTVGALAIINQELTIGALIATNMLSGKLLGPLNQLVAQWRGFTGFFQAVDRLGVIFNTTSERLVSEVSLERPNGEIVIENVNFSYYEGGIPVVNGVDLKITAAGMHALVGRNGSGKTTLLKLIQGLYVPSSGRVLLDGADISQFTRAEMAGWMGYVPQEPILFAGTVRDNIVNRKPDATDEEVLKAARESGVHQFIIDLPDGYATEIGEAGRRLSGGQRQRISIARALVGDPPVVLLDEPSSSLDRQAEQELRKTLVEIAKDRTIMVVTHSPILLSACDYLAALDKGRVALAGPAKDILPRLFGTAPKTQQKKPSGRPGQAGPQPGQQKPRPPARMQAPAPKQAQPKPLPQSASGEKSGAPSGPNVPPNVSPNISDAMRPQPKTETVDPQKDGGKPGPDEKPVMPSIEVEIKE